MKNGLSLSLLIGTLLFVTPGAYAQGYGMDEGYQDGMASSSQGTATAQSSTADTGTQAYTTTENAWQDMTYVQSQQGADQTSGQLQAPITSSPFGSVSTYLGNTGQWLMGTSSPLGKTLPNGSGSSTGVLGLMAPYSVGGPYVPACGIAGTSGMTGSGIQSPTSMYSKKGVFLPPTSTSTVDLNTAF